MSETPDQGIYTKPDEPFVRSDMTRGEELQVESHAPYLKVWMGLAIFTAIEYFYAHIFKDSFGVLVLGLMFWAVIKASMVGWFFMHLKFEGRWVYYMLVPAAMLATVLILALYPDIGTKPIVSEEVEDESVSSAPLEPGGAGLAARL
jgi:cytochrome c oxidase subunit 4